MSIADIPPVHTLTPRERLARAAELLASVCPPELPSLDGDALRQTLDERWAEHLADPADLMSLEEVRTRLAAERAARRK